MFTPETRIYENITNEDYHVGPGVSKSDLDLIHRSPAHYMAAKLEKPAETPAKVLGTAMHAAVLEPDTFTERFIAEPADLNKRTKTGKEEYAAFELECIRKHLTILTQDQYATSLAVRDAIFHNTLVSKTLKYKGKAECSIYWHDDALMEELGLPDDYLLCKCRPDFLRDDGVVIDFKSTTDARPGAFQRSVLEYRYYVQHAYYCSGIKAVFGSYRDYIFLCCEKEPPYAAAVYMLDDEHFFKGVREYRQDLKTYIKCKQEDKWPAYEEKIFTLELPKWAA